MKPLFRTTGVFLAALFILSSCNKGSEIATRIPSDAYVVVHFNTKNLQEKLPWSEIKSTAWFQAAYNDSSKSSWSKKLMEDPSASGIDADKGLVLFVSKGEGEKLNIVIEGDLKSAEDFLKFNQPFNSPDTVNKDGNLNLLSLQHKGVVGWDDTRFIYVVSVPDSRGSFSFGGGNQSPLHRENTSIAAAYCKKIFNLPKDSSLAKDKRFTSLLNEKGDIHAWVNSEIMMKYSKATAALGMLKLNDLFEDSRNAFTANFEKGAMVVNQKSYLGKELTKLIKKYKGPGINTSLISKIPSDDIIGLFSINFKPEGLKEFLKLIGVDGFANLYLTQVGLTLDELTKALSGDFLVSVSDLTQSATQGDSITSKIPKGHFLFAMGIGDKASFQKLQDALHKVLPPPSGSPNDVVMENNDKLFAVSNNQEFAKDFIEGKQDHKPDFLKEFDGKPLGFFMDINKILSFIPTDEKDSLKVAALQKSKAFWDKIVASGGNIKGDAMTGKTTISLVDKNTNSLKQLNTYLNDMYLIREARMKKIEVNPLLDSLLMPPPVDTVKVP